MRLAVRLLALAAVLVIAKPALADRAECSPAYEQAQRLRKAGKLIDARTALVSCSQEACPAFIRKDCAGWLTEVEHELPAVAVRVLDRDGCDRPDVTVLLDGREAPGAARGASIDTDPGTHSLRAELDGEKMEQTIVLARGERDRLVTLSAGPAATCGTHKAGVAPPGPPAPAPLGPPGGAEHPAGRAVPTLALVLGGVGIVGLGVGTAFSVSGLSQRGTLDDCRGACTQTDVDAARRSFLIGDVGIGVGLVALAAATVLYLTR